MLITRMLILIALVLFTPFFALAKEPLRVVEGIVVKVTDGDTVTVESEGAKLKVRLYGIDAPEVERVNRKTGMLSKAGQQYGEEAYRALGEVLLRQRIRLEIMDIDRYRRLVGVIWKDNRNINREMVAAGWAWAYRQYLDRPHASEYLNSEDLARRQRRGLWAQNDPVPPWEFRKQQKGKRVKAAQLPAPSLAVARPPWNNRRNVVPSNQPSLR